ncbi:MAG: hypothetical protein R3D29_09420 [Nitratireductor sp.]
MTIEYLKRGKPVTERDADDARVVSVEAILANIEANGDKAVREYSRSSTNTHRPSSACQPRRSKR